MRALLLATTLAIAAMAQQNASTTKPPAAAAKQKQKNPAPSLRERIMERAHAALAQLAPEERAQSLGSLTRTAADYKSPRARDWAEELFQAANGLSGRARQQAQADAVGTMTQFDQARAAAMLQEMDPDPPSDSEHRQYSLRAAAAQRLIEVVWGKFNLAGVPVIRQLASSLAQNGEYPYGATGMVIQHLGANHADLTAELFQDAMSAYQRSSSADSDIAFCGFLRPVSSLVAREQLKPAFHLVVRNLESHESSYSGETIRSSAGAVSISYLDTQLFQLLPLIRRTDPGFAEEIQRDHPQIARAQAASKAGTVHFSMNGARPPAISRQQQDLDRGTKLLSEGGDAKMLAQAMPDAATRAAVFAQAAQGVRDHDHAQAEDYLRQAYSLASNLDEDAPRMSALGEVAWAADAVGDAQIRRKAIEEAFPIAERLVRSEFDDQGHYKPGDASEILHRLVQLGMETDPEATLARIDQVPIPVLRAGLLVGAANAALPEQKVAGR